MMGPVKKNRFGFPDLGIGVGLRTVHYGHVLEEHPPVAWFEIITENFIGTHGRPAWVLEQVAERYPVVMHGVSLSIGSTDALDFEYLRQLKELARRIRAPWVSDHLCWTGVAGRNLHDLLPLPYTEQSLRHVVRRVRAVQDFLERPLALENPSSYVEFSSSSMPEWEFLARVAEEADCALLLDVNNVYVSSFNHGFDPLAYVDAIPHERVVQYHLAGHTNHGTHIIDSHNGRVIDEVWRVFERSLEHSGGRSTLLEWDEDIPTFAELHAEALRARAWLERARRKPQRARAARA
jgi:uncharacterized protein (UPF0276 family)